jgi:bacillithiol biosynthesis cysteine-adding enzyme BshC
MYDFGFDEEGVLQSIQARERFPVNRKLLVEVLKEQYHSLDVTEALTTNIDALQNDNCFTICTAHQPNLLTGYLYFVYKILHAIKLANYLNRKYSDKHFVPVYYMGSEDNDINELGVFNYNNQVFRWSGDEQKGAFGRMNTNSIKPLLDDLFKIMGPPSIYCNELKELLVQAYLQQNTIADATLFLINELFGKYGLVVINPDNTKLKSTFVNVMKDDLFHHSAYKLNSKTTSTFDQQYKKQAFARPVNLFYLQENLRERIEMKDDYWFVVGTKISWTEKEISNEIDKHPERFSPNVILRGIFQETILPNVVFIGGGSEVAYWLQLKSVFHHYGVFFPSIHLRQSVLFLNKKAVSILEKTELNIEAVFKNEGILIKELVEANSKNYSLHNSVVRLDELMEQIHKKAVEIDVTLSASATAAITKMKKQLEVLQQKMFRAEKRRLSDLVGQIQLLKECVYPSGVLQERFNNFIEYYPFYGQTFFEILLENIEPFRNDFLVFYEA